MGRAHTFFSQRLIWLLPQAHTEVQSICPRCVCYEDTWERERAREDLCVRENSDPQQSEFDRYGMRATN